MNVNLVSLSIDTMHVLRWKNNDNKQTICNAAVSTSIFTKNSTQYQKRQFVSIFVLIFMSFVLSRISTTHLHLDCVNYFSMWLATHARLLHLRYSFKFLFFLWIFNSVSGKSNKANVTKARCYANCLTKVSNLSIERLSTTYRQTGNANLYVHLAKFHLNLSFTVHYFYT